MNRLKRRIWYRALKDPSIIIPAIKTHLNMFFYKYKLNKNTDIDKKFKVYPIMYIRTPKCGSSSIYKLLELTDKLIDYKNLNQTERDSILKSEHIQNKVIVISPDEIVEFIKSYSDVWNKSFKWAIVRNPYKKTISAWRFLEDLRDKALIDVLKNPPKAKDNGEYDRNYQHFTVSLTELLSLDNHIYIDQYIKFENLSNEFEALNTKLGMELPNIPHANKTLKKGNYSELNLSEEERRLIELLFDKDFVNFDYNKF